LLGVRVVVPAPFEQHLVDSRERAHQRQFGDEIPIGRAPVPVPLRPQQTITPDHPEDFEGAHGAADEIVEANRGSFIAEPPPPPTARQTVHRIGHRT
jgi:hypothetical protein